MVDDAVERRVGRVGIVAKQDKELNDLEPSQNRIMENAGLLVNKSESKEDEDVSEILDEKTEPEKQEATKRSYTYDEDSQVNIREGSFNELKEEMKMSSLACHVTRTHKLYTDRYYFCSIKAECKVVKRIRQYGSSESNCDMFMNEEDHTEKCKV